MFDNKSMRKFPSKELDKILRDFYIRKTSSPLKRKRTKIPGSVFDIQPEVSSQETTQIVVEVEPLMGFKVKTRDIIKPGGYRNIDEFVSYTLPRLERLHSTRYGSSARTNTHRGGISVNVR